jgi:hypothetical protein
MFYVGVSIICIQILFSSVIYSNLYFLIIERWWDDTLSTPYLRHFGTISTKHRLLLRTYE